MSDLKKDPLKDSSGNKEQKMDEKKGDKKLIIKKKTKVVKTVKTVNKSNQEEENILDKKETIQNESTSNKEQIDKKQFNNRYSKNSSGNNRFNDRTNENNDRKRSNFRQNENNQDRRNFNNKKNNNFQNFNKPFNKDRDQKQNNNRFNFKDQLNKGKMDVQPTNEKDWSRKKSNQKRDEDKIKEKDFYESKENNFEKNFIYKKKEMTPISSVPEKIDITDVISISDLAKKMNLKANIIISKLMELGTMVTINDKIDSETATIVASEFNCKVNVVSLYDETVIEEQKVNESDYVKRPPIVTVMGHVDHGKTKLLDAIRQSDVAATESGGITQHIGAYNVTLESGEVITFIDTPGHEAFTMMRARGAQVTDIVVLVVAADDGVMPQTIEAINHAKQANVPIVVAINKIDKPESNPDKVKQQLSEYGLLPEEWGGQTLYCEVSALKKIGIKELLETIILQAEVLELKAPINVRASGYILESKIDQGRGVVATVLISKGTLKIGDFFVAGIYYGKVRAMYNDRGKRIKSAGPSIPVEITGLENVPNAGDPFNVVETEKEAKLISSKRQELNKMEESKNVKKITLQDFISQKKAGEVQDIKVIIKADVQGSAEAIKDSLVKLSNSEIRLVPILVGVGAINESDVMLAVASKAIIIGFHVRPNMKAQALAEKEKVEIKRYNIIYDVIEDIKASMEGMIKPELLEELIGIVEVKQVFKISKVGTIAGCLVTSGKVKRKSLVRLMRDDVVIYSGNISSLKRYKDDASEVFEGMECGIALENFKDIKVGDIMEIYEIKEIARNLIDIERKEREEQEKQKIEQMKEAKKNEQMENSKEKSKNEDEDETNEDIEEGN